MKKIKKCLSFILAFVLLLLSTVSVVAETSEEETESFEPTMESALSITNDTIIYGDVDNDGSVTITDATQLNRYLNGYVLTSNVNLKCADVDKNTALDVNDIKIMQHYLARAIPSLPYSESGNMFEIDTYTVPTDVPRSYIKYDCLTQSQTSYTLSTPAARDVSVDDRILDSSANAQCIVYLLYKKSNGDYYRGTGFIVDDHIIATCAHCLYDGSAFNTDYKIKVYDIAGTSLVATYSAKELHIPSNYYNSTSSSYDYGLIYVDEDLSSYGTMALGLPTNEFKSTAQTVSVSGFPRDVNGIGTSSRYYGSGTVTTSTNDYRISYTSYTSPGDSGGPVYIDYALQNKTFRSAVGIHTSGNGTLHSGVRITLPILRFYYNNLNIG